MLYQAGQPVARQVFVQGVQHGETRCFGPGGVVTAILPYWQGKLDGEARFFNEGRPARIAVYRDGMLDGPCRDFDADGNVTQDTVYRAGMLHGTVRRYWPDGGLRERTVYRDGQRVEDWQRFDQAGKALPAAQAPASPAVPASASSQPAATRDTKKWMSRS